MIKNAFQLVEKTSLRVWGGGGGGGRQTGTHQLLANSFSAGRWHRHALILHTHALWASEPKSRG